MKLYVVTENDKYELPVAVSERMTEIAKMLGRDLSTISNAFKRAKTVKNPTGKYRYVIVEYEEEA